MVIQDLVKAFIKTNIPLKKVNTLQPFLKKHCYEGGAILQTDILR